MIFDAGHRRPFVLDKTIKPICEKDSVLFGRAFTCKGEPLVKEEDLNDNIRIDMLEKFTEGCIQVIDMSGDTTFAHYGNVSAELARKFGCIGAVIDGAIRDKKLIEKMKFPVFCKGINLCSDYKHWQIIDYQIPIYLNGNQGKVKINPGDYIFGDADGVLVIPKLMVYAIGRCATMRLKKENLVCNKLKKINNTEDVLKLKKEIIVW